MTAVLDRFTDGGDVDFAGKGLWEQLINHPNGAALFDRVRRAYPQSPIAPFYQKHLAAELLREFVPAEVWSAYFKFAVVRNPWDRVVSLYTFHEDQFWGDSTLRGHHDRGALFERCSTFDEFVRLLPFLAFPDQATFVTDDKGTIIVDFVGRFERLESDFALICRRLGVDGGLPHLNRTRRSGPGYRDYYTDETRSLVEQVYRRDVELFGYTF